MGNYIPPTTMDAKLEQEKRDKDKYIVLDWGKIYSKNIQEIVDAIESFVHKEHEKTGKDKFLLHFCGTYRGLHDCVLELEDEKVIVVQNTPDEYMNLLKEKDLVLSELFPIFGSRMDRGIKIYGGKHVQCWVVEVEPKKSKI